MNIIKPQAEELSITVYANRNTGLTDRRIRSNGIYFGTVEELAKNLGVTIKDTDVGVIASAPKMRLQTFVERLHFSGVKFR